MFYFLSGGFVIVYFVFFSVVLGKFLLEGVGRVIVSRGGFGLIVVIFLKGVLCVFGR